MSFAVVGGKLVIMTGAGGDGGSTALPGRQWDVALSFAGAQREYVGRVAAVLKARGIRCFYDADEQVQLWGMHLAEELPQIYERESAAVVVFVSADYAAGSWTRLERRAAFSRAVAEAGVFVLPARFDDSELPGLLPDVVTVDLRRHTPEQFAGLVAAKLADLAVSVSPLQGESAAGPAGGIRVSDADPRRLGVHAAISVTGVPDEVPPEYVPRDADDGDSGVRARVAAAAQRGGFMLLVGGSSAGKTRCAAEAVKAVLPGWWLVHPAGPDEVTALAQAPPVRTVVWLDELQRYFDGEHGLSGGVIRALLNAPHPVVIIGTLWPDRHSTYVTVPAPGGSDRHAREREVLNLADIIRVGPEFSPAEQDRARAAAARDPRLRVALGAAGYGLTQTLAAAPQLVARWHDARTASPYGWAVLTAALDAARLGARAPVSAGFLRAAAPGYCTSQQQAEAPEDWFERAMSYATEKLHGAAAALSPAGTGMGQTAGYTAADYLVQHVTRERCSARVPASTWDAVLTHVCGPADAARLARSAHSRLLYRYAIPLYRLASDADDEDTAEEEARLLADRGDADGLRALAIAGHDTATGHLAELLAVRLAGILAAHGDLDGATQIQHALADVGDRALADQVAELLAGRGDGVGPDRSRRALWRRRRPGHSELGELHALADTDVLAHWVLARLAGRGDVDDLRARADLGDPVAASVLTKQLAESGDADGLRARANTGDKEAAQHLAGLLARRGDMEMLRALADAGDLTATAKLAELLAGRGDLDEAAEVLRAVTDADREYAPQGRAWLLAKAGDLDRLRALADADGDEDAAGHLAALLAERGDVDELRTRASAADSGGYSAARALAGLLAGRGDLHELRTRAIAGDEWASQAVAPLLAEAEDEDGLRALAGIGHLYTAPLVATLLYQRLINQGRGEEAERMRWSGLNPDGSTASA